MVEDKSATTHTQSETPNTPQVAPPPNAAKVPARTPWRRAFFVLLSIVVVLGAGGVGAAGMWAYNNATGTTSLVRPGQDGNKAVTQQENNIAAVATKVGQSVVSIVTSTQVKSYYYGDSSGEAAGTGIIVSANGYVMTNNHVIDGATKVTVIDSDGNQYTDVSVIGRDPLNDVAFLKITSDKTFTPAEIGDSSTVRTGQQVVAIGNALGQYQNSVTSGILSGTGRPVAASSEDGSSTESLTDLLQTDASINPGNSGGPLLNLAGQVIGINTAVASNADSIGFAIPINATKGVLAGVIANGKIQRAYLGVGYLSIVPEVAKQYNLSVKKGAYVYASDGNAVAAGSPADKAGLKKGDIIQKIGNETVGEQGGLSTILGQYKPGDKVTLTVLRDGKTQTIDVTLGTYNG